MDRRTTDAILGVVYVIFIFIALIPGRAATSRDATGRFQASRDGTDPFPPRVAALLRRVTWLAGRHEYGSACVRIAGSRVIYIDPADPVKIASAPKADLILVTHSHPDHFSPAALDRLRTPSTWIVTVADCARQLEGRPRVKVVSPGEKLSVAGVTIEAVPAYTTVSPVHARARGWVGFVLTVDGVRVYHSGDTSYIPEMKALRDIDIAFFTVRPPYQMSGSEMVAAAEAIRPRVAIPIHWLEAEKAEVADFVQHPPAGTRVMLVQPL